MKVPYTIIHTPLGYQLEVDTRAAFMDTISLSVEASSKQAAEGLLQQELKRVLQGVQKRSLPEDYDWMPGDDTVEVLI